MREISRGLSDLRERPPRVAWENPSHPDGMPEPLRPFQGRDCPVGYRGYRRPAPRYASTPG